MYHNKKGRKRNRLQGFNYSSNGAYFVTICVKNRIPYFGTIKNGTMIENTYGEIVHNTWINLPNHYQNCSLGNFIVIPNHFHGIVFINNSVRTGLKPVPTNNTIKTHSLSEIIRGFKTFSSRNINQSKQIPDFHWHRSFHDRIIRNEKELQNISDYISLNPLNWEHDEFNLITL